MMKVLAPLVSLPKFGYRRTRELNIGIPTKSASDSPRDDFEKLSRKCVRNSIGNILARCMSRFSPGLRPNVWTLAATCNSSL